jgi:tetrahydromethanopterin S-methyltransferase subunit B
MRLVYVGIALTVLLGVVAFVSRGHTSPAGTGTQSRAASQWLANAVFTLWLVAMVAGLLLLVYLYGLKKRETNRSEFRLRPLVGSLFFVAAVVVGMVIAYHQLGGHPRGLQALGRGNKAAKALRKAEQLSLKASRPKSPTFYWPLAIGLGALVVAGSLSGFLAARRRRKDVLTEVRVMQELAQLVDETLDDLRAEVDPRKAVIAAYARMERILAVHGLPRRPSEAPLEYLSRVLDDLHVTRDAVSRLTALFERAKFSHHQVDPRMKDEAIDALVEFREQMRVLNQETDAPAMPLQDLVHHGPV